MPNRPGLKRFPLLSAGMLALVVARIDLAEPPAIGETVAVPTEQINSLQVELVRLRAALKRANGRASICAASWPAYGAGALSAEDDE